MIEMNISQATAAPVAKEVSAKKPERTDGFQNKLKEALEEREEISSKPTESKPQEKEPSTEDGSFNEEMIYALQGLNPLLSMQNGEIPIEPIVEGEIAPILGGVQVVTQEASNAQQAAETPLLQPVISTEPKVQGIPVETGNELTQMQPQQLQQAGIAEEQPQTNGSLQIETMTQTVVPEEAQVPLQQPVNTVKPQPQEQTAQPALSATEIPQADSSDNIIPVTQKATQEGELQADDFGRNSESLNATKENVQIVEPQTEPIVLNRETAFVKISDVSSQLKTASPEQQVIEVIKQYVGQDKSEFSIQLFPEHLGKVDVKMIMQNGVLTVEIAAENPKTQSLLMSNASEIKELVQAATTTTAQIVSANQSEQAQHYTQQEGGQEQQGQSQEHPQQHQPSQENEMDFFSMLEQMQLENRIQRVSL